MKNDQENHEDKNNKQTEFHEYKVNCGITGTFAK